MTTRRRRNPLQDHPPVEVLELCCSFCGKSKSTVEVIVEGPTVYICNECIELCVDILAEKRREREAKLESQLADLEDAGASCLEAAEAADVADAEGWIYDDLE